MTTFLAMLACLAFTLVMFMNSCKLTHGHSWEDYNSHNQWRSKVNHLCSKTKAERFCLDMLSGSDHDYNEDGYRDIARVVVNVGISKAEWIYEKLNCLVKSRSGNWEMKERYSACFKNFEDSLRDLERVKKYFSEQLKDNIEFRVELNDVLQEEGNCLASLRRGMHSLPYHLAEKTQEFEFVVRVIKIALQLAHKD